MDLNNILELENRVSEMSLSPLAVRLSGYYLESGVKIPEAINLCTNILSSFPDYYSAYYILAKCYIVEKDYQSAYKIIRSAKSKFYEQSAMNSLSALIYELIGEDGFKEDFLPAGSDMTFEPVPKDHFDYNIPTTDFVVEKQDGIFEPLSQKTGFKDVFSSETLPIIDEETSNIDSLVEKHKRSFLPDLMGSDMISPEIMMEMPILDIPHIDNIIENNKEIILPKIVQSAVIKEVITNDIYLNHTKKEPLFFDEEYITNEEFEKFKRTPEELSEIKSEIFGTASIGQTDTRISNIIKEEIIGDLLNSHETSSPQKSGKVESFKSELSATKVPTPIPEIITGNIIREESTDFFSQDIPPIIDQKPIPEKFDLVDEIAKLNGHNIDSGFETISPKAEINDEEISAKIKQGELPEKFINKTLAQIYEAQGNFEEAIEVYNQLFLSEKITEDEYEDKMIELKDRLYKLNTSKSDFLI